MKLVYGVGFNDAEYIVRDCPFYKRWKLLLMRCYSEKEQLKKPYYVGCKVCDEWLTFNAFRAWMETQDWEGKELDKDIITPGNKLYCAEKCLFVDQALNSLLTVSKLNKGDHPIGVSFLSHKILPRPYIATIRYNNALERLGYYSNPQDAHRAWMKRKREIIAEVITKQNDQRLINGLLLRLDMLDNAYENNEEIFAL